ncbi:hypothetical protein QAD02_003620 [Eretmocerus hayati]|uniref:Uncharacterized protein n=1 Tax=Eretmocerus hayati TaxID=131215 RepID=A0ACC2NN78_9HYME|nr:hypothetical protein QAD02_003620 [Eretmocerus hayati]
MGVSSPIYISLAKGDIIKTVQTITCVTIDSFDQLPPVRICTVISLKKSCITGDIRRLVDQRDAVYREASQVKCESNLPRYRTLRAEVKSKPNSAKNNYIKNGISSSADAKSRRSQLRELEVILWPSTSP